MAVAPSGSSPISLKPSTCGISIDIGWPEHRRLGLDPADAPAEHAEAVDHRRVRVGADQRVGVRLAQAIVVDEHDARQVLEVDLVHDAGVRRHDREVVERALAPAQERVALLVALELQLGVALRTRSAVPNASTCTEWSMTSSAGTSGLIFSGSPPSSAIASRIAARSTIAGTPVKSCITTRAGREGDLLDWLGVGVPAGQRLDVGGADRLAVLVAQQVLEQDLQRERQPRDVELRLQRVEPEDLVRRVPDAQRGSWNQSCWRWWATFPLPPVISVGYRVL